MRVFLRVAAAVGGALRAGAPEDFAGAMGRYVRLKN